MKITVWINESELTEFYTACKEETLHSISIWTQRRMDPFSVELTMDVIDYLGLKERYVKDTINRPERSNITDIQF